MARRTVIAALALLALCLPAGALADDDDDPNEREEARSSGVCTGAIRSELRLRTDEGRIRVDLRLDRVPRRSAWRVVVLHERRIAYRGTLRPRPPAGSSIRLRTSVDDWFGTDTIAARATGPTGQSCRVSATV